MSKYYSGSSQYAKRRWEELLSSPPSVIACDAETVSLKDRTVLGIGVAFNPVECFYITADDPEFYHIIQLLQNPDVTKTWHNAPFDLRVLRSLDLDIWNIDDTAIMSRILGKRAVLEEACMDEGIEGVQSAKAVLADKGAKDFSELSEYDVAMKCIRDVYGTYILRERLRDKVDDSYYQIERRCIPMLETISRKGIPIDQERRAELEIFYRQERDYLYALAEGYGFNPGSPQQVGYILASRGNVLPMTRTYKLATGEKILRKFRDPLIGLILNYRHVTKMLSTYILKLEGADRAYTTLHLDAITGRISGTSAGDAEPDMNLTNIPRKVERGGVATVRSMFLSDYGVWKGNDASQIELRCLQYLSGDKRMKVVFDSGGSLHHDTQEGTGLSYDVSKTLNYAMVFGATEDVVADNTGYPKIEAREFMRLWMETYPEAASWMKEQQITGLRSGYVETLFGRKMPITVEQGIKHAKNCCISYPVQGTAADIFKRMIVKSEPVLDSISLLIHDDIAQNQNVELSEELAYVSPVYTPLESKVSERWG